MEIPATLALPRTKIKAYASCLSTIYLFMEKPILREDYINHTQL